MFSHLLSILCLIFICFEVNANNETNIYQEVRNSRDFTGKVVLITGSNSGIGKQTAKLFSALGASLVITGRKAEEVQTAAKEVLELSPKGIKPLEVVADLTKADEVYKLFNKTILHFGKLNILVNDAGSYVFAPIEDPNFMEKFDTNLEIDVKPALQLIRLSIPFLKLTNGTIINIASVLTQRPKKGLLTYVIAKEALKKTTQVLAQELGPLGIRINTISPGSIESHGPTPETEEDIKLTPLGRIGFPEDIAKGVVFLASTDAEFITGTNIDIDGGIKYNLSGAK